MTAPPARREQWGHIRTSEKGMAMVFSKALGGWEQDWSRENSSLGSKEPPPPWGAQSSVTPPASTLHPHSRASLPFSKPFQRSGHWAGTRNSHLRGPGAGGVWVTGTVCSLRGVRTSSQVTPTRGLLLGPGLQCLGSQWLSFGHFFDRFDPLRGLVSHIIFRGLCPGICLVCARS